MAEQTLFVGGLHPNLDPAELVRRLSPFGEVLSLPTITKRDTSGLDASVQHGRLWAFAHVRMRIAPNELKKCQTVYSRTKWKVHPAPPGSRAREGLTGLGRGCS